VKCLGFPVVGVAGVVGVVGVVEVAAIAAFVVFVEGFFVAWKEVGVLAVMEVPEVSWVIEVVTRKSLGTPLRDDSRVVVVVV